VKKTSFYVENTAAFTPWSVKTTTNRELFIAALLVMNTNHGV
jgi:hypothetical protein